MNLTLRQLKIFEAVARHLSFTRASEELHLTQPAVSMQVKQLERIDGIWVATEMQMVTREGRDTVHATVLRFDNVKFNQKLDANLFTVRTLEKGL